MSSPARIALLLLLAGFILLFIEWRVGLLVMALSTVPLQYARYRRRRNRIEQIKGLRDDLQEKRWLEKSKWFSRKGIT